MRRRWGLAAVSLAAGVLAATAASAPTPPKLQAASAIGDRINLTFSGPLRPRLGTWTVLVNGKAVTLAGATFAGKRVQLRLPAAVYSDDVVRVVGRNLRSGKGLRLRAFDVKPANRSTSGCSEQPGTVAEGTATEGPTDRKTFLSASRFRFFGVRIVFPDGVIHASDVMNLEPLDRLVRDLSYGRSSLSVTSFGAAIQMPKARSQYALSGPWDARKALFADLIANLDPVVDFREYDGVVVTAETGVIMPASIAAIAPVGQGIQADGRELRHFLLARSTSLLPAPLLQLAGLPWQNRNGVGDWDLMAGLLTRNSFAFQPPGLLAWHRRKLGWLGAHEIRCLREAPLELTLEPIWRGGGVKALVAPMGRTAALVLETRQLQGHDAAACARGILPYRVVPSSAAIAVLHRPAVCNGPGPHDAAVGQSIRVAGAAGESITFQVLALEPDGSYRLRVSR